MNFTFRISVLANVNLKVGSQNTLRSGQFVPKQKLRKKCADINKFYEEVLDCSEGNFISEVKMWVHRFHDKNIQNALDALSVSNLCYNYTTKIFTNLVYQYGFGEWGKLYTMQNPVKKIHE